MPGQIGFFLFLVGLLWKPSGAGETDLSPTGTEAGSGSESRLTWILSRARPETETEKLFN